MADVSYEVPSHAYVADVRCASIDSFVASQRTPRVLVVEDEPAVSRMFENILQAAGYDVLVAQDGRSALRLVEAGRVDAVVTDIDLPEMDGIGVLAGAKAHDPSLPVLLITGRPDVESAAQAVALGAQNYLSKPIDPEEFVRLMAAALTDRRDGGADVVGGATFGRRGRVIALDQCFQRALDKLWPAFQPIVSWQDRRVVAYEALVRSDEATLPHPGALFDAGHELGRTRELSMRMWQLATERLFDFPEDTSLFLNLLPEDLCCDELYLPESSLAKNASRIVLEITERSSLDDVDALDDRVSALRALGYRIAVDDLGAGYSSLASIAQLSPDVVKLDMSIIRGLDKSAVKQRLVASMLSMCKDLGSRVVAEGVETVAERDALIACGCDWLQGFYFGRPTREPTRADFGDEGAAQPAGELENLA